MTLNQIAQQAMDYLDSVGVSADWAVSETQLLEVSIISSSYFKPDHTYICAKEDGDWMDRVLKKEYPQKSPA